MPTTTVEFDRTKSSSRLRPSKVKAAPGFKNVRWPGKVKVAAHSSPILLDTLPSIKMNTVLATVRNAGIALKEGILTMLVNPEELVQARYLSPDRLIELTFADGFTARRTFEQLEIDTSELRLNSARASASG